ncbi:MULTISPECIES: YaaC family protein [Streptomyces]|uniref:YaaC family protein n=1 Tax=Streptomyces edwardsiae TaxID=3075527 RepID=A0ABU2Q231_9ACTN|nr:YaaC family protein [Streptomyces sp. DSM 41636]MDT0398488.1 YaaC family protein [Streptomyces sp. DSM 41636]
MSYPGTLGYHGFDYMTVGGRDVPRYERHNPDAGWLHMHWEMLEETASVAQRRERLRAMTRAYAGHRYFFPAVAGLPRELHPLMAWWVILYALSMLARYQPAQWAGHIDVDGNRHAVPIEKVMERAMEHLPVLIADTIEEVSTWP